MFRVYLSDLGKTAEIEEEMFLDSSYDTNEIYKKIKKTIIYQRSFKRQYLRKGNASKKLKKILENINVDIQKQLTFE